MSRDTPSSVQETSSGDCLRVSPSSHEQRKQEFRVFVDNGPSVLIADTECRFVFVTPNYVTCGKDLNLPLSPFVGSWEMSCLVDVFEEDRRREVLGDL